MNPEAFDHELSKKIDVVIVQLDACDTAICRVWLRLQKMNLERRVLPVFGERREARS